MIVNVYSGHPADDYKKAFMLSMSKRSELAINS